MGSSKIIVALDGKNLIQVKKIVNELKFDVYAFKIGYEFFFNYGINGYKEIKKICPNIFLDLKLHDIPNTVEKGIKAISNLKPLITTIHISGGNEMMKASKIINKKTKVVGVSILTSLNSKQTKMYYNDNKIESIVKKFVKQAQKSGLDGVVCSPKEIKLVRRIVNKNFIIITPGIRINKLNTKIDDQKRVLSPKEAVQLGADYLVIGRPIMQSKNPLKTVKEINESLI